MHTPRFHFQQSHYRVTEQQDVADWRQEVWRHFRAGQPDAPINKNPRCSRSRGHFLTPLSPSFLPVSLTQPLLPSASTSSPSAHFPPTENPQAGAHSSPSGSRGPKMKLDIKALLFRSTFKPLPKCVSSLCCADLFALKATVCDNIKQHLLFSQRGVHSGLLRAPHKGVSDRAGVCVWQKKIIKKKEGAERK